MTSSAYEPYGDVTYQVDDTTNQTVPMTAGGDNRSLGLWSGDTAIPFIRELLGHTKLAAKMIPFSEPPVIATFDISKMEGAIASVREECGW